MRFEGVSSSTTRFPFGVLMSDSAAGFSHDLFREGVLVEFLRIAWDAGDEAGLESMVECNTFFSKSAMGA